MDKKRKILIGAGGVVLVAMVAIVAWAQANQVKKGSKVMEKAIEQLQQAGGLHSEINLSLNLPERMRNRQRPLTKVSIDLDGDVVKSGEALEVAGVMNLEAKGPGNIFFAQGEISAWENITAFKLSEFPVLLNPSGNLSGKWTYVRTRLLGIKSEGQPLAALRSLGEGLTYQGTDKVGEEPAWRYSGTVSDEASKQLQEAWRLSTSDNKGLDVIARLLAANKVKQLDVWVAKNDSQLRQVKVNFVRPLSNGNEFDFATLDILLTDYGKVAVIDRPAEELTVKPEVFAKLFGTGEIEEIKTEE